MINMVLAILIPILVFWCGVCGFMWLYDTTKKPIYAVIGLLPISFVLLIQGIIEYVFDCRYPEDAEERDWLDKLFNSDGL